MQCDFRMENLIWQGNELIGLIDFDRVGWSLETMVKDVSIVLQHGCYRRQNKDQLDLSKARFFIKEYEKYEKLSKLEIEFIPVIIAVQYIDFFNYTYWLLENDRSRAQVLDIAERSKAAQWYIENKDKISDYLLS